MAFGSSSAIFVQSMKNPLLRSVDPTNITLGTGYTDLVSDTINIALFGNSGTPSKTDTMAHIGYGATGGQWVTGNETTGAGYTAGGKALPATIAFGIDTTTTNALAYSSTGTLSWTGASITAYGDLMYDASITAGTILDQGICYHSYGGSAETVSGGTFTVSWYSTGYTNPTLFSITV